jgi:hypothetical protein
MRPILASLLLLCCTYGVALAERPVGSETLQRLLHSHDPSVFVTTGALYLKQEAIRTAGRKGLSESAGAEVDRIIDAEVRDPAWFYAGMTYAVGPNLSEEDAEAIVTHFATDVGAIQRRAIELSVGEVLTSIYTFTDRIDYRIKGSSREMDDLQRAVGPMRGTCACPTPREREEMLRVADGKPIVDARDLSNDPDAVKFAVGGAGARYMKILSSRGVAAMTDHFEAVARQVRKVAVQDVSR